MATEKYWRTSGSAIASPPRPKAILDDTGVNAPVAEIFCRLSQPAYAFCTLIPHIVVGWRHWRYHQCGSAVVLSPRPQRRPPDYTSGANTHALSVPTNNTISLAQCTLHKRPSSRAMGLEYHQSGPGGKGRQCCSSVCSAPTHVLITHNIYIAPLQLHCWTLNLVTRRCLFGAPCHFLVALSLSAFLDQHHQGTVGRKKQSLGNVSVV